MINLQTRFLIVLALIVLSVPLSGCVSNPAATKVPPVVDNFTLQAINWAWIKPSNVSIIDSSAVVTYISVNETTNVTEERILFNTTDGKTHTTNLTIDHGAIGILDVDGDDRDLLRFGS